MMFAFLAELIELACAEIEVEIDEVDALEITASNGIWSVLIGNQEVFFMHDRDRQLFAYHTNCYDEA